MLDTLIQKENLLTLAAIFALILISAFFSGSETALTAASKARIKARLGKQSKRADAIGRLLDNKEQLIGALLLGNNLVNILASSLMAGLMLSLFNEAGIFYATLVMTLLILIFAEVMPKTYAITDPETAALRVSGPVGILVKILAPIVGVIQILVNGVLRLFGVKAAAAPLSAAEEIRGAVDLHHEEGGMAKRARDQIYGVLTIGDLIVEDVMIHRKNLSMVDGDLDAKDVIKTVLDSDHTRLPIWRGDKDNVIGVLHAKDMLKLISEKGKSLSTAEILKTAREPWFVPETTPVVTQLKAFQQKREHFALAVDEYGALMGAITLEDILEEIVGDIQDEFDTAVSGVRPQKDGSLIVRGDVPVRDLNRARDWDLPDDEAVTIAGLVIHESQTIPDEGRVFHFHGYRFEVLKRIRNQITSLRIRKLEQESA